MFKQNLTDCHLSGHFSESLWGEGGSNLTPMDRYMNTDYNPYWEGKNSCTLTLDGNVSALQTSLEQDRTRWRCTKTSATHEKEGSRSWIYRNPGSERWRLKRIQTGRKEEGRRSEPSISTAQASLRKGGLIDHKLGGVSSSTLSSHFMRTGV